MGFPVDLVILDSSTVIYREFYIARGTVENTNSIHTQMAILYSVYRHQKV